MYHQADYLAYEHIRDMQREAANDHLAKIARQNGQRHGGLSAVLNRISLPKWAREQDYQPAAQIKERLAG